ncbi:Ig-like domain-containing domain [Myroides sp. LJL119]
MLFCFIFFANCAKRGSISGGPKDTLAPILLYSTPKNFSTNFNSDEIKIVFDEYIKINKLNQNLIVSPPLQNPPEITPMGIAKKVLTIRLRDTLKPNTTYSFNFGDAIVDNNEGNVLQQFKYIFSTGEYIDSLKIQGNISTAHQLEADNFVNVMLYPANSFTDSTVYKQKPIYLTNTLDSLTSYSIENLKEGYYKLIALKDKNNDYKFDPNNDKIAFLKDSIYIPTDKTYDLVLFKTTQDFKAERPSQISSNKWYLPYVGDADSLQITLKKNDSLIRAAYSYLPQKDSLQLWFENIPADSLNLFIKSKNDSSNFTLKPRVKIKETDSLSIQGPSGILHYTSQVKIQTTTPVDYIDKTKFNFIAQDSVDVDFEITNNILEQNLVVDFAKQESFKYNLQLLPGAIVDFFGQANDTISFDFNTQEYKNYGNLTINLNNVESFPIIIELLDTKLNVITSQYSTEQTQFNFDLLTPRDYLVRITYDTNKNGKWDTGDYLRQIQPEKSVFYPEVINVRANWDLVQTIDL